ncbi:MAG: nucleotidyltransferase domain-containing protein [Candidatus Shapirobacteria bacterium]|jgi:predicted nucleotidyltransferase
MEISEAIQKTIDYAGKFGMKLSREQLWSRLMGERVFSEKEFEKEIGGGSLSTKKKIEGEARKKKLVAKRLGKMVAENDNNILMVAVTGSVAAENCKKGDDIDILIVTRENRLWWSRLKLLFFLINKKYKFRRYGKREIRNELCFNMWLEEKSLKLPSEKRDERSAVDLILLKVVVDKDNIYHKLLRENDWAKNWVATGYSLKSKSQKSKSRKIGKNKKNIAGDLINLLAFVGQYLHMWPKKTKENVGLKAAFFHLS